MAPTPADALAASILQLLREAPREGGVSLPRLGKRLGLGASTVMRQLTLMGDSEFGGQRGPGWVRVVQRDERWVAQLTEAGREAAGALPAPKSA